MSVVAASDLPVVVDKQMPFGDNSLFLYGSFTVALWWSTVALLLRDAAAAVTEPRSSTECGAVEDSASREDTHQSFVKSCRRGEIWWETATS